jgi:hypothetical protein
MMWKDEGFTFVSQSPALRVATPYELRAAFVATVGMCRPQTEAFWVVRLGCGLSSRATEASLSPTYEGERRRSAPPGVRGTSKLLNSLPNLVAPLTHPSPPYGWRGLFIDPA